MAIDIKFDLVGNPEPPTIILANRNGNMLGQLNVDVGSIELDDKFNDASEFSFTIYKNKLCLSENENILYNEFLMSSDNYLLKDSDDTFLISKDSKGFIVSKEVFESYLWDKVVDFKLVYCKEWDCWFEIKVELDEATKTVKTVFCTQLGQAELSQIMLYDIEINTENDIARDDYKISILYDENDPEASILNRLLKDKAPHYSIAYVSPTIAKIQRSFSFDGTSILDAFEEIAEEIGCVFQYYAGIENGKLQRKIAVYDLQQSCNDCWHRGEFTDKCPKCSSTNITNGYGEDTLIFITSDELATEGIQLVTDTDSVKNCFKLETGDDLMTATVRNCNPNGTDYIWRFSDSLKEDMSDELVDKLESYNKLYKQYHGKYVSDLDTELLYKYNSLVEKYAIYNEDLQPIATPITGYSNLMNAYYNTIDLSLYLESGLMPSIEMSETNAEEQVALLTASSLSPVAVADVSIVSLATANSAVLAMAKTIVRSTYKIEIKTSELYYSGNTRCWKGKFVVTNYSDEEDIAEGDEISVELNDDLETVTKQKINKILNKEDTDDYSITGLFEKEYNDFCAELKKYALNPLTSFHDACQSCIDILIEQGVGNGNSWSDDEEGSESNLYEKLYLPYYNKLKAIEAEMKVREDEINVVSGVYDNDGNLIAKGLQSQIEECRNKIQNILNFEDYLGEELWLDFCAYRREDKYSNDNYISDGLNNAELFKKAQEFFEVAENEIYKSSELQHSISTTLNNLLAIPKFKPLVKSFKVGNWIRVQVDNRIFKLRLLEYKINFGNFKNIPVEFSDVTKIKNGITDVESILSQASSMATSYDSVQRQANQGDKAKSTLEEWISDGLNSALVQIQSNDSEDISLTKHGLLCRSYDEITGTYAPEQLKLTHNIIAYTDDEWKTVRQAIGKHEYSLYDKIENKFIDKIGYGMNADFVVAGVVSGSQIIGGDIYSDNFSVADRTGSYLNLRDGTFSFGGGALRFDNGKLTISSPDIPTTDTITEINEEYLKTTTVYASGLQVKAANIQDKLTASQINTTGLIAENISGTTIEGKTISGGSIKIGNNFNVSNSGVMECDGAKISGEITATSLTLGTGVKISTDNVDGLSSVAISGDYNSLSNKPTIPTQITDLDGSANILYLDEVSISSTTSSNGITTQSITVGDKKYTSIVSGDFVFTDIGLGTDTDDGSENYICISTDGLLTAKNAIIYGNINATSGYIGGCEIVDGLLKIKNVNIAEKLTADQINTTGLIAENISSTTIEGKSIIGGNLLIGSKDSTYYAEITTDGVLNCSGANIDGVLSAGKGSSLGSFEVDDNSIFSGDWSASQDKTPDVFMCTGSSNPYTIAGVKTSGWAFGAGKSFGVTKYGALYSNSGKIGGWDINTGQFSSGNSYISSSGIFCFMPDDGDADNWCGFLKLDSDTYNFCIGSSCQFQIGNTVLTEADFKKLLALI